jgi:hypothetical protein
MRGMSEILRIIHANVRLLPVELAVSAITAYDDLGRGTIESER